MTEPIYPPLPPPPPPPPPFRPPYQAPQSPLSESGWTHEAVREKLKVISIVLLSWTALSMAYTVLNIILSASSGSTYSETLRTMMEDAIQQSQGGGEIPDLGPLFDSSVAASQFLSYFQVIILSVVLVGAWKMFKAENYGLAMAAAVLASIPCVGSGCCCLGMIPGIWSLIILLKPEVKAGFR